jgi:cell division protease FtsH
VSEQTSQMVDAEVKRVITKAYDRAKQVLSENIELLHTIAAALLERETLTREDILMIARGEKLPPRTSGVPPAPPLPAPSATPLHEPRRNPPLLGGPEPAPA